LILSWHSLLAKLAIGGLVLVLNRNFLTPRTVPIVVPIPDPRQVATDATVLGVLSANRKLHSASSPSSDLAGQLAVNSAIPR
jgi:hypothetical protein